MGYAEIGGDPGYGRAAGVAVQLDCVAAELFGVIFLCHRVRSSRFPWSETRIKRVQPAGSRPIGLLPVSEDAAEGFYRLVDAAYERRAIAVSSNLHPSGFDEIMPKTLATATVDRLLHHAHVVVTDGDSFRLTEATTGKGVKPFS